MIIDEEVYLEHFGKKGMRWGVRNQVRRETKAKKYDAKAAGIQTKIDKVDIRLAKLKQPSSSILNTTKQDLSKKKERFVKDAKAKREGKLTRNQKIKIGASIAVGATVAGLIIKNHKNVKIGKIKLEADRVKKATDLINDRRNVEMSSLTRMHKEGKMDAAQFQNFSKILNDRYARKLIDV